MDEITINCPRCNGPLLVTPDLAGQSVSCPGCNNIFQVNLPPPVQPGMMNPPFQQPPVPMNPSGSALKIPELNFVALGIALLALIVAGISFFVGGKPEMKFSTDPEDAMKYTWKYFINNLANDSSMNAAAYYLQKHGSEYVSNMEVVEIKTNGNYVYVFCKTEVNGSEKRICSLFRKNSDGYWISSDFKDAKKEVSSSWCDEMDSRRSEFTRNYGVDWESDL